MPTIHLVKRVANKGGATPVSIRVVLQILSVESVLVGTNSVPTLPDSPALLFFKTKKGQESHIHVFSFLEKHPTGKFISGPAPLVPELQTNQPFEIMFNPQEKMLSETIKNEFMSAFTQLIGSVISEDAI